jgi:LysR family glycine cleavage system transcriptional activator
MKRGQLPLTALRSFEAAGRHESFTRAAAELLVSQAAVSRQVRELEDWLGHALFERRHRQVVVTAQGRALLAQLTQSFDAIDRLLEEMRTGPAETVLPLSVEPSFASAWLVPRLDGFRRLHPEIDVAIAPDSKLTEFRGSKVQLAIRWSAAETSWPRAQAEHLADVIMSPVIAPGLLAGGPPLRVPEDLRHYTLLHEDGRGTWARWFELAGAPGAVAGRGPLYTDTVLATQAALRGHGVALADLLLAEEQLHSGALLKPFTADMRYGAYWLVAPNFARLGPAARAFAGWIRAAFTRPVS